MLPRVTECVPEPTRCCGGSTVDEPRWQLPRDAPAGVSAAKVPSEARGRDSRLSEPDAPMHVTGQTLLSYYQSQSERHREALVPAARFKRPRSGCVTFVHVAVASNQRKTSHHPRPRSRFTEKLSSPDGPRAIHNLTPAHLHPNTTTPSLGPCKTPDKQRQHTEVRFHLYARRPHQRLHIESCIADSFPGNPSTPSGRHRPRLRLIESGVPVSITITLHNAS